MKKNVLLILLYSLFVSYISHAANPLLLIKRRPTLGVNFFLPAKHHPHFKAPEKAYEKVKKICIMMLMVFVKVLCQT